MYDEQPAEAKPPPPPAVAAAAAKAFLGAVSVPPVLGGEISQPSGEARKGLLDIASRHNFALSALTAQSVTVKASSAEKLTMAKKLLQQEFRL